jgi:hypothetical protein
MDIPKIPDGLLIMAGLGMAYAHALMKIQCYERGILKEDVDEHYEEISDQIIAEKRIQ